MTKPIKLNTEEHFSFIRKMEDESVRLTIETDEGCFEINISPETVRDIKFRI